MTNEENKAGNTAAGINNEAVEKDYREHFIPRKIECRSYNGRRRSYTRKHG